MQEILRMENVCNADYLNYANINIRKRETVGLLGLNNAGKTELLRIMSGFSACEKGALYVDDKRVELASPLHAQNLGVHYIHDDNALLPSFTVAENIFVMQPQHEKGLVNAKYMVQRCNSLLERMRIADAGICISAEDSVSGLDALQKLVVLIAKAVSGNARLIVVDHLLYEFPQHWLETLHALFRILMEEDGISFVLTDCQPHSLSFLCDRIFVMRDGMVAGCFPADTYDEMTVTSVMTGYRAQGEAVKPLAAPRQEEVLAFRDVVLPGEVNKLSFEVHANETVGFCCMSGDFGGHFAEALFHMKSIKSGSVLLEGKELPRKRRADIIRMGIGVVSDEATVFTNMELVDNVSLMALKRFSSGMGIINKPATSFAVSESIYSEGRFFNMAARDGGMSKLAEKQIAIQRSMAIIPKIMIYLNLDRGLDHISYNRLLDQISNTPNRPGASVFLSANIHKLLPICTKIYFIHEGRVVNMVYPANLPYDQVLAYYMRFCRR